MHHTDITNSQSTENKESLRQLEHLITSLIAQHQKLKNDYSLLKDNYTNLKLSYSKLNDKQDRIEHRVKTLLNRLTDLSGTDVF